MTTRRADPSDRLPWLWGAPRHTTAPAGDTDLDSGRVRRATRAVETVSTPEALFLWLCQLRRAPYSYDWIDNLGRRSPRDPDLGMTDLRVGQTVMTIFTLTAYEPLHSLTLRMKPGVPTRIFGAICVRYEIERLGDSRRRLRATLWLPPVGPPFGDLRRYLLAWGDLVMMRRQLHVLCSLAEATSRQQPQSRTLCGTA